MADYPTFLAVAPLRCSALVDGVPLSFCADLAHWMKPAEAGCIPEYFCDEHRSAGCEPIPDNPLFRRVQISAEIIFSAVSGVSAFARLEALEQLEGAIAAAGGVLNLLNITDVMGRGVPQLPPPRKKTERARG